MRSANPALKQDTFKVDSGTLEKMTVAGAVNKSFILIAIVIASAYYAWQSAYPGGWSKEAVPSLPGWYFPVIISSFVLSLVIIFNKPLARYLAMPYAILEGLMLGAISAIAEQEFPGIVMQAVLCTMGTFVALLTIYKAELIEVTDNFRLGLLAAMGGIFFVYLADFILGFFDRSVPHIHESTPLGIGFSIVVTAVAALNLVLDFDFIEEGEREGAPQYMEWYAAFGLLITLVWLYLEFLRLIAKFRKD